MRPTVTTVDPAALADWTAANRRARAAYLDDPLAASAGYLARERLLRDHRITQATVRHWAAVNGMRCNPTGRLPGWVIDAYLTDLTDGAA